MDKLILSDNLFFPSFEIGRNMINKLDIDRLLAPCFEAMGKKSLANRYGGWEARGISGHTLGHYMSALSYLYDYTKDSLIFSKAKYCVDMLASIQGENGYIAGFPEKESFDNVFKAPETFKAEGFELGGWWVPYYSLHKIFRGLLDIYEFTHYEKALEVSKKIGIWVYETTSTLNAKQRLKVLKCEYGGMNDALARLYMFTYDERYLTAAKFFCEEELLTPLSEGKDNLSKRHANTQIPKVIGSMSMFEATKDEYYFNAAKNFFDFVSNNRSYALGGHSLAEHFEEENKETLGTNTCETCNTNNMLQLAMKLWKFDTDAKYFDFIEKALFNHILPSQDETGMKTYFVGLKPGNHKVYSTLEDSFWCCFGSGLENPFNYSNFVGAEKDSNIYINLFIESENEDIQISAIDEINYSITFKKDICTKVYVRKPSWCKDFKVTKGNISLTNEVNGYIEIEEVKKNDELVVSIPKEISVNIKRDDEKMVYFTYGNITLAEKLDIKIPYDDHVPGENDLTNQECPEVTPLKDTNVTKLEELKFQVDGRILVPFYTIMHERYVVYFEVE